MSDDTEHAPGVCAFCGSDSDPWFDRTLDENGDMNDRCSDCGAIWVEVSARAVAAIRAAGFSAGLEAGARLLEGTAWTTEARAESAQYFADALRALAAKATTTTERGRG